MKIAQYVSWQRIADRVYIIDENSNSIIRIEDVAADIWVLLSKNLNRKEIVKRICCRYQVEEQVVKDDVDNFANDMIRRGLILVK